MIIYLFLYIYNSYLCPIIIIVLFCICLLTILFTSLYHLLFSIHRYLLVFLYFNIYFLYLSYLIIITIPGHHLLASMRYHNQARLPQILADCQPFPSDFPQALADCQQNPNPSRLLADSSRIPPISADLRSLPQISALFRQFTTYFQPTTARNPPRNVRNPLRNDRLPRNHQESASNLQQTYSKPPRKGLRNSRNLWD